MHDPDDFDKLAEHYSEAAKRAKSASHQRMLGGLARFYATLIKDAGNASAHTEAPDQPRSELPDDVPTV